MPKATTSSSRERAMDIPTSESRSSRIMTKDPRPMEKSSRLKKMWQVHIGSVKGAVYYWVEGGMKSVAIVSIIYMGQRR